MARFGTIHCEHDGTRLEGLVARPAGTGPFPTVMVMHSANGLRHQVQGTIETLAGMGFLAIATDMYGPAAQNGPPEACHAAYARFTGEGMHNVRARSLAWFAAVRAHPDADPARLAAIGYCFGGHCVLELARAGAGLRFVVSYHGTLGTHARAVAGVPQCEIVAYCGAHDPFATLDEVDALRRELADAGARYQITVFGEAAHSFTDPDAGAMGMEGIRYNAMAHRMSWAGTVALLETLTDA
ncbi:MAG: dienelactone hydrolase family protein [Novosphingobium sp.]|jgi:dienelactone hydrolase|nr:dienelactone hydrolase family protein [Novosphingobium sp.]